MKTAILAILVFSPFCIVAQQYPPQGEWQPNFLRWHFENEMQSQPAQVPLRPAPDFDEVDATKYIQVLAMQPPGSQIGCIGIVIIAPPQGDFAPIKVVEVWRGSLAEVAGIKPNWFIISIDGVNAFGMSAEQFFSYADGTVGTFVTLDLADPIMSQTKRITIKRELSKFPYFELQPFIYKKPAIFDSPPNQSPNLNPPGLKTRWSQRPLPIEISVEM